MGNEMPVWLEAIVAEWTKFLKKLFKFLVKAAIVIFILLVIAWTVIYFVGKSFSDKIMDPANGELVTIASALPLACSIEEAENSEDDFDELAQFISVVEEQKAKCGSSMAKALGCYQDAMKEFDEPMTYVEIAKKGKRLYSAQKKLKNLLARTVARLKAIETYDDHSAALKKEIVSLASYINNHADIFSMITNGEKMSEEVERRYTEIAEGENLKAVSDDLSEKYPDAIVFIFPTFLSFPAFLAMDKGVEEAMLERSEVYRKAKTEGCLKDDDSEGIYLVPAIAIAINNAFNIVINAED